MPLHGMRECKRSRDGSSDQPSRKFCVGGKRREGSVKEEERSQRRKSSCFLEDGRSQRVCGLWWARGAGGGGNQPHPHPHSELQSLRPEQKAQQGGATLPELLSSLGATLRLRLKVAFSPLVSPPEQKQDTAQNKTPLTLIHFSSPKDSVS